MRRSLIAVLAAGLVAATAGAATAPKPAPKAAAPPAPAPGAGDIDVEIIKPRPFSTKKEVPIRIAWRTDLDTARQEAARYSRVVLIFFCADWSQPAKWMNDGTFVSLPVAGYVGQHFIPVRIDDSTGTSPVTKQYDVRVYPTGLFLAAAGKPLHMGLGPRPPQAFYGILKQVAELPKLIEAQRAASDDLEANFAVGNAFAVLNQLRRGEPYLKRAAELAPKNQNGRLSQARLLLAIVPLEDGDAALAMTNIEAYLKEFKDAPEVPVAIFYQGTILFQDGKLVESRRYFEEVRERFPAHPKAYDADKAIEAIDLRLKALKAAPPPAPKAGTPASKNPPPEPAAPAAKPVG